MWPISVIVVIVLTLIYQSGCARPIAARCTVHLSTVGGHICRSISIASITKVYSRSYCYPYRVVSFLHYKSRFSKFHSWYLFTSTKPLFSVPLSFALLPFTTSGAKISIPLVRYKLSLSPPLVLIAQYRLLTVYTTVFFLFLLSSVCFII